MRGRLSGRYRGITTRGPFEGSRNWTVSSRTSHIETNWEFRTDRHERKEEGGCYLCDRSERYDEYLRTRFVWRGPGDKAYNEGRKTGQFEEKYEVLGWVEEEEILRKVLGWYRSQLGREEHVVKVDLYWRTYKINNVHSMISDVHTDVHTGIPGGEVTILFRTQNKVENRSRGLCHRPCILHLFSFLPFLFSLLLFCPFSLSFTISWHSEVSFSCRSFGSDLDDLL